MVFLFVFANQNSGPSSPFGFVGEVPTRSESTSSAPADLPPRSVCLPRLGRGPELLGELVGALDRSFLGVTLNLQSEVLRLSRLEIPTRSGLSTFNRVSFLFPSSPHLCALCVRRLPRPGRGGENSSSFRSSLIPRHSPLTAKSFTIRTYEKFSCKSFRIRTYKNVGGGSFPSLQHSDIPICLPFIPFIFMLFQTLLHFFAPTKNSTLLFSCNSTLFDQNTRGWGRGHCLSRVLRLARSTRGHFLSLNLQLSIEDPDFVGTVNFAPVPAACRLVSERSTIVSSRIKEGTCHGHRRTENSCHGVHQRTLHRFFQARQPRAHGERPEKNGLRIRP